MSFSTGWWSRDLVKKKVKMMVRKKVMERRKVRKLKEMIQGQDLKEG